MFAMNALTVISTDLLTPLGAYLRLREGGRASFLLESVEQGRLGRHSFVGCGSRLVSFDEAEALRRSRSSATSATTTSRGSSRPCPLPDDGPRPAREPLRRRRHARPLRPRRRDGRGALRRPGRGRRAARRAAALGRAGARGRARARPAGCPSRHEYERAVVQARRSTSAPATRSRSCSRSAPSGRPRRRALELYRSLRRVNPSPYLFLLELDGLALVGSSPETLVKARGRAARR